MLGAAAVLLRCAVGHLGLRRLARSARPLANAEWQAQLAETAASLGLRRMPDLRASEAVGTPVTWGVRRPFVILPAEADSWPSERRRAALLHELAHLERGDYLAQLAGTVACAVYWFHPLAWMALRQLKRESERACDDRVLAAGAAPAEYAAQLLEVARGAHARRLTGLAPAIAMARPSTLEGRLLAVLDETTPRGAISLRSRLAGALAVATLLVPFASLTPVARAAAMAGVPAAMAGSPEIAIAAIAPRVLATVTVKPDGTSSIAGETATGEGEQTDTIDAAVTASPGEELELDLETGADVSIQGWDEPRVEVNGTLGGRDWRDSQITVSRESGGVRVHSFYDRRARSQSSHHELTIRVPRRFDVDLESAGGDLAIRDVEGSFHGSTGGGSMTLTNLRGEAKLSTGGGEVNVSDSNLSGTVSTGGGGVRLSRISGGLRGNSGSGPVVYRDPPPGSDTTGAVGDLDGDDEDRGLLDRVMGHDDSMFDHESGGMLHISRAGGEIHLAAAPNGAEVSTGGGDVVVGRSAGLVDATTGGGDIEVGPVAGSVHAGTGAGSVKVTLADAKGEEQNVEVRSGTGAVTIVLPAGSTAPSTSRPPTPRTGAAWQRSAPPASSAARPPTGTRDRARRAATSAPAAALAAAAAA